MLYLVALQLAKAKEAFRRQGQGGAWLHSPAGDCGLILGAALVEICFTL